MADPTHRVALLARPGAAAERVRTAVAEAGVQLVLEADPTASDPAALVDAAPQTVVVLLDSAVEEVLERFDAVLADPGVDVLYEEADLAARREGWDAARWTRHLSAKLLRHGDVLPPGREPDQDVDLQPGRPPTPAQLSGDAQFSTHAGEAPALAAEVPATTMNFDPVSAEYDSSEPAPEPASASEAAATPGLELDFDLSLEPHDDDGAPAPQDADTLALPDTPVATPAAAPGPAPVESDNPEDSRRFQHDLADIERRIASMELVGGGSPRPAAAPAQGAVLVFAGIGGPDAVRQFLGELPERFPRPVLIHQRLDGGRYDRLVQQMTRATSLPVQLAVDGAVAEPGHVYILPPELGVQAGDEGLRFAAVATGELIAALPAADSAVLMFSGSDAGLVDAAMNHAWTGALVAGQSPDGCYDAAAPDALVARGGESGQPAELAHRLVQRWPT